MERLLSFATMLDGLLGGPRQKSLTDEFFEERTLLEANCFKNLKKKFFLLNITYVSFVIYYFEDYFFVIFYIQI